MNDTDGERLLTTQEAADYLNLAPETVRQKVREGDIPAIKLGSSASSHLRFRRSELDRWITSLAP